MGGLFSKGTEATPPQRAQEATATAVEHEAAEQAANASPESAVFDLGALEAAVEELKSLPPAYVLGVSSLSVPTHICSVDGVLSRPKTGDGPWDLIVRVKGDESNPAYDFTFKVRLRFTSSEWPAKPPDVRFQCVFHHALVDDSGGMLKPFYKKLEKEHGIYTLRLVLEAVHRFLVDPLVAWSIEPASAPTRLLSTMKSNEKLNKERLDVIKKYSLGRQHPELFEPPILREEWFDPVVWKAHTEGTPEAWRLVLKEELAGEVFSFKMFTDAFCDLLLEELFNFYESGLPAKRPNSMNNYGIILNEIGLEPFIDELQAMLQPLGELQWPGAGSVWDGHHCFIVRYREGEDLGLDMHTDDSDVTFNVCLGLDFDGAGLQFCGVIGAANHRKQSYTYKHKKGHVVCHLGRKRHGADDITRGERLNLILWNHSSTYRASDAYENPDYVKEEGPPDPVCVSYTHDRDYGLFKEYPTGKEKLKGRGWCPPKPFEYAGFKTEEKAKPTLIF